MADNILLVTHMTAALSFGLLLALLAFQWRGTPLGPSLALACALTVAWGAIIAAGTLATYPPIHLIQGAELARNAAWLFFLLQLIGFQGGHRWRWIGRRWLPGFLLGLAAAIGVVALQPVAERTQTLTNLDFRNATLALWIALAVTGLMLLEQVYRNTRGDERWAVKFLCLGLGALFAYDLFMYAQALMLRQLNGALWQARGLLTALVVPWLLVAIARSRSWRIDVRVSRHVVVHTVTLMGAGIYLIAMAVVGYFIKYLGGSWGTTLQALFLFASGVLLLTLLFSTALRRRLRVFLSKHFFSYRYDYREEWLKFTQALTNLEGDVPAGILKTMAGLVTSPGGIVYARDAGETLRPVGTWNCDSHRATADLGNLVAWIERTGWVIDLEEWRSSPDLYGDLELPASLRSAHPLWLIVPLLFEERLEGMLLLRPPKQAKRLNWEDRDLLKTAGRQAAALLAQHRASQALVEARQFEAFNRLSAYVIHDLKNILAQQSLMLVNARKHKDNPAFVDDMISTVESSVGRMERLMTQMRSGLRAQEIRRVAMADLLEEVLQLRSQQSPAASRAAPFEACDVLADRERLLTVFNHLVQNAQEATPKEGSVALALLATEKEAVVTIKDTGCGMSKAFIDERLFRPFESTKGLTGMGIGAFESREYVRQLGGDIVVESSPGQGSTFTVTLPVASVEPAAGPGP